MATDLLTQIHDGNTHKTIPEDTYTRALSETYEKLYAKYGDVSGIKFDPKKHLSYHMDDPLHKHLYNNTRRLTMEELGLTNKNQISPIGVSDPFPLFTEEATDIMRLELLKKEIFLKYSRVSFNSTSGLDCQIRGFSNDEAAQFTTEAWTHPKTLELVLTMAGTELEVVMDYEIASTNVGLTPPEVAEQQRQESMRESALSGMDSGENIPAIVGWHYDSYPFVCVLMLSDTSTMVGGETYLRMGDGKIAYVSGPRKGNACVLQGRLIQHLAPKPIGASERITMVTSYRPKDPLTHEGSVLSTVKPEINFGSRYNDFYPQWIDYRLKILQARLENVSKMCKDSKTFNKKATTDALKEIEKYLVHTYKEMEILPEEWDGIVKKAGRA